MAIRLNTPRQRFETTDQAVTRFVIQTPHKFENGMMKIDRDNAVLQAYIQSFDDAGTAGDVEVLEIPLSSFPTALRNGIRSLYAWTEARAQTDGVIPDGAAEEF